MGSSKARTASIPSGSSRPGIVTARNDASIVPARIASTAASASKSVTTSSSTSGCAR